MFYPELAELTLKKLKETEPHVDEILTEMRILKPDWTFTKTIGVYKGYDVLATDGKQNIKIEIKQDLAMAKTGNFFCEFFQIEAPSGISVTRSDKYWICYFKDNKWFRFTIKTDDIRDIIKNNKLRTVSTHETKTKGYLIPESILSKYWKAF